MGVEHCECGAGKKVGLQDRVLVTRRACIPRCPAMHAYVRSRCRCSVINRTSPCMLRTSVLYWRAHIDALADA